MYGVLACRSDVTGKQKPSIGVTLKGNDFTATSVQLNATIVSDEVATPLPPPPTQQSPRT